MDYRFITIEPPNSNGNMHIYSMPYNKESNDFKLNDNDEKNRGSYFNKLLTNRFNDELLKKLERGANYMAAVKGLKKTIETKITEKIQKIENLYDNISKITF